MATLVAKFAGLVELTVGVVMSSPPTPPPPVPSLPPHPAMSIASGTAINHIICLLNNFCMWVVSYALHTEYCQCKFRAKDCWIPPYKRGGVYVRDKTARYKPLPLPCFEALPAFDL